MSVKATTQAVSNVPVGSGTIPNGLGAQYATFYVDQIFFGIEVLKVQEVLRYQRMTPVPLAPSVVEGLINLRGQIVTAVDLRERIGLPKRGTECPPHNVVVTNSEGVVSLLVDGIGDVVEVRGETFETPPETIPEAMRAVLEGVYKLDGKLLLVLSVERVLEFSQQE